MKKTFLILLWAVSSFTLLAQDSILTVAADSLREAFVLDSIDGSFSYKHGEIMLSNGVAKLKVPQGFKYLDEKQSLYVLTKLWNNPEGSTTLGMLFLEDETPLNNVYAYNIDYDAIGYVKDADADDINYDDLLKQLKDETIEGSKERVKQGYEPIELVGWGAPPFYDKEKKILHWAKEIKFGDSQVNTLNYNVRVLGRKGVLILNAVSSMDHIAEVKAEVPKVLGIVDFVDGEKYGDFNPDVDNVAAWTIGGLVAGKILAKVGFFALILKFWKLIVIGAAAAGAWVWKRIRGKKASGGDENTSV